MFLKFLRSSFYNNCVKLTQYNKKDIENQNDYDSDSDSDCFNLFIKLFSIFMYIFICIILLFIIYEIV